MKKMKLQRKRLVNSHHFPQFYLFVCAIRQCHLSDWRFLVLAHIQHFITIISSTLLLNWYAADITQKSIKFLAKAKDLRVTVITGDTFNWFMNSKVAFFCFNLNGMSRICLCMSSLFFFHINSQACIKDFYIYLKRISSFDVCFYLHFTQKNVRNLNNLSCFMWEMFVRNVELLKEF